MKINEATRALEIKLDASTKALESRLESPGLRS
jgi:hypothetical protein